LVCGVMSAIGVGGVIIVGVGVPPLGDVFCGGGVWFFACCCGVFFWGLGFWAWACIVGRVFPRAINPRDRGLGDNPSPIFSPPAVVLPESMTTRAFHDEHFSGSERPTARDLFLFLPSQCNFSARLCLVGSRACFFVIGCV